MYIRYDTYTYITYSRIFHTTLVELRPSIELGLPLMADSVGQELVHHVLALRGNKVLGAGKVKLHGFRLFHLGVLTRVAPPTKRRRARKVLVGEDLVGKYFVGFVGKDTVGEDFVGKCLVGFVGKDSVGKDLIGEDIKDSVGGTL